MIIIQGGNKKQEIINRKGGLVMKGGGFVMKGEKKPLHQPSGGANPREPLSPLTRQPIDVSDVDAAMPASPLPVRNNGTWVLRAEGSGTEHRLTAASSGEPIWVGRWKERVGVWLDDGGKPSKASRLHARLEISDGKLTLTDNNSANGTFVNSERVPANGQVELHEGDRLGFGSVPPPTDGSPQPNDEMPRFHFLLRLHRVVAARELANAPEIDFTAGNTPPHAPAPAPAQAAVEPTALPPPLAAAPSAAAFEAGEKETLLSLLGCMRSQLKSTQSALKAAQAEASTSTALHTVTDSLMVNELQEAEEGLQRLVSEMEAKAIEHAKALETLKEESSKEVARAAEEAAKAAKAEAEAQAAAVVQQQPQRPPQVPAFQLNIPAINQKAKTPQPLNTAVPEKGTPESEMSYFDLSQRLQELSPGEAAPPTDRSGGEDQPAEQQGCSQTVLLLPPTPPPPNPAVAGPSESELLRELHEARAGLAEAKAEALAAHEVARQAQEGVDEASSMRARMQEAEAEVQRLLEEVKAGKEAKEALKDARVAARASAVAASASECDAATKREECERLQTELRQKEAAHAARVEELNAVCKGLEAKVEGLAKEKEAAVEAALADLIDVHKATLEKSKEEYGRRVEEEAAKTRAAEVLRKAAVDEAKEEYEARMVAERALEMAAMEEDVDVVPKEEVDAAVVATAKAHAEELAVLMAKLKAFEERAEAAEAKAEAEAATRRTVEAAMMGKDKSSASPSPAPLAPLATGLAPLEGQRTRTPPVEEPEAISPLSEPEVPAGSGKRTPPRRNSGSPPQVQPNQQQQYHTPNSGGGHAQKPGMLRRWGFLFKNK